MTGPAPTTARFAQAFACAARSAIENALGPTVQTWPWSARCSRLLDLLVLIEESAA